MNKENCFILLGETGKGKSSLTKILSGNKSVKVGDSMISETQCTTAYDCEFNGFKYCLIDTPGYNDSNNNDKKNYAHIKQSLTCNKYSIKGIVLLFSFQDTRFGESHKNGLEKIVNLMPLDNFWDYFIIIFTFCYREEDEDENEFNERKTIKLKYFESAFNILISAFNRAKNIKKIPFSKIKIEFVNLKHKKHEKDKYKNLISIFKEKSNLEPFYHKVEIDYQSERLMILNKDNQNIGDLFDVKFKVYKYMNKKGKNIKTITKPIEKKFIKQITKQEYDGEFQKTTGKVSFVSGIIGIASIASGAVLSFFCPPAGIALMAVGYISDAVGVSSIAVGGVKNLSEYLSNKEFNEQRIINEILLEDDE